MRPKRKKKKDNRKIGKDTKFFRKPKISIWKSIYPYSVLGSLKGDQNAVLNYLIARWSKTRYKRKQQRILDLEIRKMLEDD